MKILVGGTGRMGSLIAQTAKAQGYEVIGMMDAFHLDELPQMGKADVVVDFSHRDNLSWICEYVTRNNCALVYGTTGLDDSMKEKLNVLSKTHPVFFAANFSYGVAVLQELIRVATPLLRDAYDIELVETHHNKKADAPSGTAKALLDILNENGSFKEVYGREGMTGARGKEIGVHSLRGGTEAGEHSVHFFGNHESITITHHADDRQIFVDGALRAATFIVDQKAGMYNMKDLLFR